MFEQNRIHLPYGDQFSQEMADIILDEFASITWTDKGLENVGGHDDTVMSTWKAYVGIAEQLFNWSAM
jgi:hypothetical protein